MFLIIIPILIFAITCLCLPQLLMQIILGAVGYFICRAMRRKSMAKMIIIISILCCIGILVEKVMPIVKAEQVKQQYLEDKIDDVKKYVNPTSKLFNKEDIQSPIDKVIEKNLPDNSFLRKITEYPRTK